MNKRLWLTWSLMGLVVAFLAACTATQATPSPRPSPSLRPSPSATPFRPSPTPLPLAARVNGTPIPLADFQAEWARFRAAQQRLGTEIAPQPLAEAQQRVLDDLIDRLLLAQGAREHGYTPPDDEALWAQAVRQAGGEQALRHFLDQMGYDRQAFLQAYRQTEAAAWMVRYLAAQVPEKAEQVHARQILVYNEQEAQKLAARLQHGEKFEDLAAAYDPIGRGDLGWFPRGYLLQPQVEEAAFALQPGQVSEIITTGLGYHIIKVEARGVRVLSPDARRALQMQAVQAWLRQRRSHSEIQRLLPTPSVEPQPTPTP